MVANLSLEVLGGETIPLENMLDRQVTKLPVAFGSESVECSPMRENENCALWGGRSEFVFSPMTTNALSVHLRPYYSLLKTYFEEASLGEKIRVMPEDITESGRTASDLTLMSLSFSTIGSNVGMS